MVKTPDANEISISSGVFSNPSKACSMESCKPSNVSSATMWYSASLSNQRMICWGCFCFCGRKGCFWCECSAREAAKTWNWATLGLVRLLLLLLLLPSKPTTPIRNLLVTVLMVRLLPVPVLVVIVDEDDHDHDNDVRAPFERENLWHDLATMVLVLHFRVLNFHMMIRRVITNKRNWDIKERGIWKKLIGL